MKKTALFLLVLLFAVPGICQNDQAEAANHIKIYNGKIVNWKKLTGQATLIAGWILDKEHCVNVLESQNYKRDFARDFHKRIKYVEVDFIGSHPMAAGAVYTMVAPDYIYLSKYWLTTFSAREFAGVLVHEYVHTLQALKLRALGSEKDSEIEQELMNIFEEQATAIEGVCMGMAPEE